MPELAQNEVPVLNQSGQLVAVPKNSLPSLLRQGYRVPGSQEIQEGQLEEKYGIGTANELKTFGENVLGGATFNLSKIAENALGITTPEAQAARQRFNPWAAGLGQAVGIGGSAFALPLGGAVGLLGKGATEAGVALAGSTAETLAMEGIGRQIAARTIGGALEGAVYGGLGQSVNEAALGDPTLNAQKVFYNAALGALFGGAIGGGVAALGAGARKGGDWLIGKYGREAGLPQEVYPPTDAGKFAKTLEVPTEDVEYYLSNKARIEASPRLGTKLDPSGVGQETLEQRMRDAYESLGPRIKTLADDNAAMLEQSNISKSAEDLGSIFNDSLEKLKKIPVKGRETEAAIGRVEGLMDQVEDHEAPFTAPELKSVIGELDSDLESFYAGKIGRATTKQERVLLGLRTELSDALKNDMTKAGFEAYSNNLGEMHDLINTQSQVEKYFGNATGYQRAISELAKVEQGFKGTAPLVQRGIKKGVDWIGAINDLGEASGQDFQQMYKDRATWARLFPEEAVGLEKTPSWLSQKIADAIDLAMNPQKLPGKVVKKGVDILSGNKTEGAIALEQKAARDALQKGLAAPKPGLGSRLLKSLSSQLKSGSDLFKPQGQLEQLLVPEGVSAIQFLLHHDDLPDAEQKLETLVAYERARNAADREIASGVNGIFKTSDEPIEENKKLTQFVNEPADKQGKSIGNIVSDLNTLVNNPDVMIDRLGKSIEGLEKHAPNLAQGLNMTATRAVQFLAQRLQLPDRKPLDGKFVPSKQQVVKASKYLRTIQNPYSVLEDLKRGNFSQESKDVLVNVMPELYDHLKQKVIQAVADRKQVVPQSKRFSLSYFLDQDLDSQLTPQAILKNMSVFQSSKQQAGPRGSSSKHLTIGNRLLTPMQQVSQR